jgi:hypothetical protein
VEPGPAQTEIGGMDSRRQMLGGGANQMGTEGQRPRAQSKREAVELKREEEALKLDRKARQVNLMFSSSSRRRALMDSA